MKIQNGKSFKKMEKSKAQTYKKNGKQSMYFSKQQPSDQIAEYIKRLQMGRHHNVASAGKK